MLTLPAIDRDRLLRTFIDLVKIDSPPGQEAPALAYVRRVLDELGLESSADDAGNIYCPLAGRGPAQPWLLVNAHVDTVQPTPNIKVAIADGVVRTDGSTILGADDKAGVAAILEVVRLLRASAVAHAPLDLLFTVGEEIGLVGAKAVDFSRLTAKVGVCLDVNGPPRRLVTAAPGQNSYEATFHGRSAHAGVAPEEGINAIQAAAKAIASLPLGRLDGETTANVGLIRGGQARNIVPDRCALVGEVRSRAAAKLARYTEATIAALRAAAQEAGCRLDLNVSESYQAFTLPETTAIVQWCQQAVRSRGQEPTLDATGGGSDANVFNQHGIAVVVVGVGYEDIHTPNERIAVASLVELAETLLAVAHGGGPAA